MLIAQISDSHVVPSDSENGKLMGTCAHLEDAVAHLVSFRPRPDAVLVSGDLVEDGSREEYKLLIAILAPLKADIPVYVAPGNHDERETMREMMRTAGYDYLPEAGFLHYTADLGELRLISLDTLVPGEPGGHLCAERLAWLDARLEEDKRPTLIMQHHPPFATGLVRMDTMGVAETAPEASVVGKYNHVLRILCGHLHRSISCGFAGTMAMTAPSCAHAVELDLQTEGRLAVLREPPGASIHLWRDGCLVTHTSFIGEYGAPYVIAE
ncbi:MAG: phosphodiesterase [Myxococcales bacterium]|nr:phosphodiesterase [Myxococcales bacterium]